MSEEIKVDIVISQEITVPGEVILSLLEGIKDAHPDKAIEALKEANIYILEKGGEFHGMVMPSCECPNCVGFTTEAKELIRKKGMNDDVSQQLHALMEQYRDG